MNTFKGYIIDKQYFRKLFENTVMVLGHVFEAAYVVDKITKREIPIFEFDFDPDCGLIGKNNDWCLVGGNVLVFKTFWTDNTLKIFSELKDVHSLRAIGDYTVQILIDPWSEQASIWQMEIGLNKLTSSINLFKLKDFKDYADKPYTEEIVW